MTRSMTATCQGCTGLQRLILLMVGSIVGATALMTAQVRRRVRP